MSNIPLDMFAYALLEICNEEGNTASVEVLRNNAFNLMQAGQITTLVTSTLNGKTHSVQVNRPADEVFIAATKAIRLFNTGIITSTQFDFTFI